MIIEKLQNSIDLIHHSELHDKQLEQEISAYKAMYIIMICMLGINFILFTFSHFANENLSSETKR